MYMDLHNKYQHFLIPLIDVTFLSRMPETGYDSKVGTWTNNVSLSTRRAGLALSGLVALGVSVRKQLAHHYGWGHVTPSLVWVSQELSSLVQVLLKVPSQSSFWEMQDRKKLRCDCRVLQSSKSIAPHRRNRLLAMSPQSFIHEAVTQTIIEPPILRDPSGSKACGTVCCNVVCATFRICTV